MTRCRRILISAGIVAAFLFALLALAFYYIVTTNPSPMDQARELLETPRSSSD